MSGHNFVVEKLREILANLEQNPPAGSSSSVNDAGNGNKSAKILSEDTSFSGLLRLKGREIIGGDPSNSTTEKSELLPNNTEDFRDSPIFYGKPSLFPPQGTFTRETSTVFGVQVMDFSHTPPSPEPPNKLFELSRRGLVYPLGDDTTSSSTLESSTLMKHLQELIHILKSNSSPRSSSIMGEFEGNFVLGGNGGGRGTTGAGMGDMELNLTLDDITDLNKLMTEVGGNSSWMFKHVFIIVLYLLIACVSIIGNLLVVQLVIRSRRLHTLTHALLANLAVADIFMATLNIPFSAARVILAEWPFGSFLCQVVPFVQVTSVYVTSITMAVIAIDRYQVIMNPLGRRMKSSQGAILVLVIWSLSAAFSLPFALHQKVVTVLTVRVVRRCQADFASMEKRRWLTVATVLGQYLIPLTFTTASYVSIMMRLGLRSSTIGSTTPRQVAAQSKAKRKTIKMLVLTVIFFAVCWAPINAYHLLTHFGLVAHNSTAILTCHLIAMSSTCYNPFIYCWLNEHFRREALKWLRCFRSPSTSTRPASLVHPRLVLDASPRQRPIEAMVRQPSALIQLLTLHRRIPPASGESYIVTPPDSSAASRRSNARGDNGILNNSLAPNPPRRSRASIFTMRLRGSCSSGGDAVKALDSCPGDATVSGQSEDTDQLAHVSEVSCALCQRSGGDVSEIEETPTLAQSVV